MSVFNSPVIYVLQTVKGYYIGKYNDGGFFEYHLKKAMPWIEGRSDFDSSSAAFEHRWRNDIKQNGYKNSNYVLRAWYAPADVLGDRVFEAFSATAAAGERKEPYTKKEVMDLLRNVWHVTDKKDYEILETLMIVLGRSSGLPLENVHNNWLTRNTDAKALFSTDEMLDRELRFAQTLPDLWITLKSDELEKINKTIETAVYKHTRTNGDVVVNLSKNQQFIQSLSGTVSDATIRRVVYKLKTYYNGLKGKPPTILKELEKEIKEIEKGKGKGALRSDFYDKLVNHYENAHKNWKTEVHTRATKAMKEAEKLLQQWLDVMPNYVGGIFNEVNISQYDDVYKKEFTKYIQSIFDAKLTYSEEYSRRQHNEFLTIRKINHWSFLPKNMDPDDLYNAEAVKPPIQDQLLNESGIQAMGAYVTSHWLYGKAATSVYGEQISIWLKNHDDTFYHEQMFPKQALEYIEIQNY